MNQRMSGTDATVEIMIKSNGARVNVFPEKIHHCLNNKLNRVRLTAYSSSQVPVSSVTYFKYEETQREGGFYIVST